MRVRFKGRRPDRRRLEDALTMVVKAAELAVSQGAYPCVELALFEMAANQRRAVTLGVDVHDLLKAYKREGNG